MSQLFPALCIADDSTSWAWKRWPEFAAWPHPDETLVVCPIAGFVDWGLGHPLDSEELVLTQLLRSASLNRPAGLEILVLPVLRYVLGPGPGCCFSVTPPEAHAFIDEIAQSVQQAGFRKILLLNSSPWNEQLCDAAARDLRIDRCLQMFCVNLAALGLDFHPERSHSRRDLQTLITALLGVEPSTAERSDAAPAEGGPRVDGALAPALEGAPLSLAAAAREAPALLDRAGQRLGVLLAEIAARAPLPHEGRIPTASLL